MAQTTPKSSQRKTPSSRRPKAAPLPPKTARRPAVKLLGLWLVAYLVLLSFFLNTIMKDFRYIEIFPQELVLPTLMHGLTAAIIAFGLYWLPWPRSFEAKLVSGIVLALFMINFDGNLTTIAGMIRAFTPGITGEDPYALVGLVYLLVLGMLSVLIGVGAEAVLGRLKRVQPRDVRWGIVVFVAYLFVVPAFSVARLLPLISAESRVQAPEIPNAGNQPAPADKPDIYYLVLDRYTNNQVLKDQFAYDNSPFTNFLKDNQFHVNENAYANYPYTTMSVSSTLNAQYTNEVVAPFKDKSIHSRTLYHNLIRQSSVIKALKRAGYEYHHIGSWYGATEKAPLAYRDHVSTHTITLFGKKKRLRGLEALEFTKSPYYHFGEFTGTPWWPFKTQDNDHTVDVRNQLNTLDQLAATDKPGGRFIFAHILVPHDPYVFNADGSLSQYNGEDSNGLPIKQKYLNQAEFINTHMQELVMNIQKQSNEQAVIIFNADEGPYPQSLNDTFKHPQAGNTEQVEAAYANEDMRQWSDDWLRMKFGILQAVHIPKATTEDLAHLSSVNVFRIILNRYLGYNLDYLPECHFGVNNGSVKQFYYSDITQRFTGHENPYCKDRESLPGAK